MLALGLEATAHYGARRSPTSAWATSALFSALIAALDLAPAWKRRLVKDFNRKSSLAHDLDRLTLARRPRRARNIRACWRRSPAPTPRRAHALVTDLLSIAGITAVGGRSVGEIADRFLEQAALGAQTLAAGRDPRR